MMQQGIFSIGIFLLCFLLSVHSLCNFPCSVQTGGDYDGELGSFKFSCDNSSRLLRIQGGYTEIQECFARSGPFTVLRRNGNEYQCVKEASVTGPITWVYETDFLKMWDPPTVCSICTPVLMRPMIYVDPNIICKPGEKKRPGDGKRYTLKKLRKLKPPRAGDDLRLLRKATGRMQQFLDPFKSTEDNSLPVTLTAIGCNRPKNCPLTSTLDLPCTGCEPYDDGSCCPECKQQLQKSYAFAYAYADSMLGPKVMDHYNTVLL